MTDFITRVTELCGPKAAQQLQAEFGGTSCHLPKPGPSVSVVLHAHFSADRSIDFLAAVMPMHLQVLAGGGVVVSAIGIKAQGMGDAYIAALQEPLRRFGVDVIPMR